MAKAKNEATTPTYSGVLFEVDRLPNDRLTHLALFQIRTFHVEDGVIVREERSRGMVEPELYARYMSMCENKIADASTRHRDARRLEIERGGK